ncbi:glycoside hydrolase family 32 protein [Staphylococcus simulans]|uniref:glycoside hydrolase family 32 protein n=1 Tax=Staphylococcus simulans TaxID=1286 RepID=UPI0021D474F3|nr:glycoside hydrolase family 32 protein [Staphylococcus simulans]UXR33653.1 glycoside hydrolase family 32 protein [Staphylococcus simulans]
MQDWINEVETQRIEQLPAERIAELKDKFASSPYKQTFHLQPPFGSAGKPNGLLFDGKHYLISHVWYPFTINNGLSYSYAYQTPDLIQNPTEQIMLKPDGLFDDEGIKGGSAIEINQQTHFIYSAKSKDAVIEAPFTQLHAVKNHTGEIEKYEQPINFEVPEGYVQNVQDPKVFEKDGTRFALLSAQTEKGQGRLLAYHADDLNQWQLIAPVHTNLSHFGDFWHASDYLTMNGYDILTFTAENTEHAFKAGYLMGHLHFHNFNMNHGDFKLWDDGFGFVFPQTFEDAEGSRVLIGLLKTEGEYEHLPEIAQVPCLSIPRQLTMHNGKIYQTPHSSLKQLRYNEETALGYANKFAKQLHPYEGDNFELQIEILENDATEIYFEVKVSKWNSTKVTYNTHSRLVTLDCSESGEVPLANVETKCSVQLSRDLEHLQIFVDQSSIEVFCNHGERVMSSRIFPPENSKGIRVGTESGQAYLKFTKYDLHGIYEVEDNSEQ